MKPQGTFYFMITVFAFLAIIMSLFSFVLPKEGVNLLLFDLQFPTFTEMFVLDLDKEEKDLESILLAMEAQAKQDSVKRANEAYAKQAREDSLRQTRMVIQYPNNDKSLLHPFFAKAYDARRGKQPVRVLHYGDSQIEGDRMTGYIRDQLQRKFGGNGPGLVPVVPVVPSISVTWSQADNMQRYTYFGARKP